MVVGQSCLPSLGCLLLYVSVATEPDWVTAFAKKQEQDEKAQKLKVCCIVFRVMVCFKLFSEMHHVNRYNVNVAVVHLDIALI